MFCLSLQLNHKLSEKRDLVTYQLLLLVTQIGVMHLVGIGDTLIKEEEYITAQFGRWLKREHILLEAS